MFMARRPQEWAQIPAPRRAVAVPTELRESIAPPGESAARAAWESGKDRLGMLLDGASLRSGVREPIRQLLNGSEVPFLEGRRVSRATSSGAG